MEPPLQRTVFVTLVAALSLSSTFLAIEPAQAEAPSADAVRVSLAHIDPSSAAGADRILRRIRHAARDVCDVRSGVRTFREIADETQCVRETMRVSVASLNE